MERLLTTYGIPYSPFRDRLQEVRGVVAGSAALAIYLEENNVEAGYEPNDMDIWIPTATPSTPLSDLFFDHGYVLLRLFKQSDHYAEQLQHITKILTFQHYTRSTTIQVIHVDCRHVVHEHIIPQFDISACMTWWDPYQETADTFIPEMTLKKQMLLPCTTDPCITDPQRFRLRVEKYKARGFVAVEPPPSAETAPDERKQDVLAAWKGKMAFDVVSYEDVDIAEHLSSSEWNIVLLAGESAYAFERRTLFDYLKQHGTCDRCHGWLYDTPYRHTLTEDACASLLVADHSVYELIGGRTYETTRQTTKTLYTVRAYSLEEWTKARPRRIFPHPLLDPVTLSASPSIASLSIASPPIASLSVAPDSYAADELYQSIRDLRMEEW